MGLSFSNVTLEEAIKARPKTPPVVVCPRVSGSTEYVIGQWIPITEWEVLPQTCGLYIIRNLVDGKEYVGKSVHIRKRIKDHIRMPECNRYLYRAFAKHGLYNFECCIYFEADEVHCSELETLLIEERNCFVPKGFNMTKGGDGATGWRASDEMKQKMRENNLGKVHSEETKKKMSNWHQAHPQAGKKMTETQRKGLHDWQVAHPTRQPCSEETKRKIALTQVGLKRPEQGLRQRGEGNPNYGRSSVWRKEVFVWEEGAMTPKLFAAGTLAAKYLGVHPTCISEWCLGKKEPRGRVVVTFANV